MPEDGNRPIRDPKKKFESVLLNEVFDGPDARHKYVVKLTEAVCASESEEAKEEADGLREAMDAVWPRRTPRDTLMGVTDKKELEAMIDARLRLFEDYVNGMVNTAPGSVNLVPIFFNPPLERETPPPASAEEPTPPRTSHRSRRRRTRFRQRRI